VEFHGTVSLDPVTSGAFWAAYKALGDNGVQLAELRRDVAGQVVRALLERRGEMGMGYMLAIAQANSGQPHSRGARARESVVHCLLAGPSGQSGVPSYAVDAAVAAAARVLAEG